MRFEGTLHTWNDDRGFGFIEPAQGGQEIFVHISAFGPRFGRPRVQQLLSFEVELGPQGKKRAKNVELVQKLATRSIFWGTVILNVAGFLVLCSPMGRSLWAPP
jgi:cold shock CspA family protein